MFTVEVKIFHVLIMKMKKLHSKNQDIITVKHWLDNDDKPTQTSLSYGGVMSKTLWAQINMLETKEDLLYRKWKDDKETTLQATIPFQDRRKVLSYCHNHKTVGYLGVRKILVKLEVFIGLLCKET